jgi:hypothetical protein
LDRAGALVKDCLKVLAHRFSDNGVIVDESTSNASRICKLYGTLTRKGDATPDRPHRYSAILEQPECAVPVSVAALEALAAEVATAAPKSSEERRASPAGTFNIDGWIADHSLDVVKGPEAYRGRPPVDPALLRVRCHAPKRRPSSSCRTARWRTSACTRVVPTSAGKSFASASHPGYQSGFGAGGWQTMTLTGGTPNSLPTCAQLPSVWELGSDSPLGASRT